MLSRPEAGGSEVGNGGGYGVLMMSDSLGAADVVALEKVRRFRHSIHRLPYIRHLLTGLSVLYVERLVLDSALSVSR